MTGRRLWLGLSGYWALAAASLVAVHPRVATGAWPRPPAAAVGAIAGVCLAVALAGRRPLLPPANLALVIVVVAAAAEEVVWRRLLLGTLAERAGTAPALVASTVAFAFAHRAGRRVHLVTGGVFGCLYVVSASLVCTVSAHAVYNVALTGLAAPPRAPEIGASA